MSTALVFVFLLDELPEFNRYLNETLHITFGSNYLASAVQSCNSTAAHEILTAVSKNIDLPVVPAWKPTEYDYDYRDIYSEVLNDLSAVFDSNMETDNEKDLPFNSDINNDAFRRNYDVSDCEVIQKEGEDMKGTKREFPKSAAFLVAIFETVSNVTAQTCAGTVVAPKWVLTAASCLNLLSNLYTNDTSTNSTEESHYTLIAGSTNPLSGGTGHNVTRVLLHPGPAGYGPGLAQNASALHDPFMAQAKGPFLALLRIDPGISEGAVEVVGEGIRSGEVMVYGWVLIKNATGSDTMELAWMSATVLAAAECRAMYSYRNNDVLCLYNNDHEKNIILLSSGGPVLAVHEHQVKLLAVVQTDEHIFVAYSVAAHRKWVQDILNEK